MKIDYLKYEVELNEHAREFIISIKTTEFKINITKEAKYMFVPIKGNKIVIDMDTGMIKNPKDVFAFIGQNTEGKDMTIGYLMSQVVGFEFEMEQAYEKGLYYRAINHEVKNEL